MPKVDLIASRDFTYSTRRLKAGDEFQARNPMDARILVDVRRSAAFPTAKPVKAAPVEATVAIPTLDEVLTAEVVEEPVAAPKQRKRRKAKARK